MDFGREAAARATEGLIVLPLLPPPPRHGSLEAGFDGGRLQSSVPSLVMQGPDFEIWRRPILFGVPLVLGALELGHPGWGPSGEVVPHVAPIAVWWTALHILQVPLFALLGIAALLLLGGRGGRAASLSRYAIAVFIVVYPAFDGAVGISSGVMLMAANAQGSSGSELEPGLWQLFWGPVTGSLAIVGSASWAIGTIAAAWALRKAQMPVAACSLLALSGVLLGIAHIRPIGPLACLAFFLAAVWMEFRGPSVASAEPTSSSGRARG